MRNLVKTTKESKVKVLKNEKGVLKIRFLGIGYGDKDNKDLDGEFFTDKTDFSDDFIPIIGLNYDHLPYWSDNPFASRTLKSKLLGSAKFVESTEEGRWYEAEVAKAESYQEYIAMLAEKGYLGASTQAMPGSVTVLASGEIVDWAETGMALTVRPTNSDTLNTINEMAKSFSIPLYPEIKKSVEDQAVVDALAKQKAEEDAAAAAAGEDEGSDQNGDDTTSATEITIDTEGLVEDVKTAATAAIAEAMEAPLTAINNIVTTLTEAVEGIKSLTDDEQFKSFITDFSENLAENNRQLKAVTFVVANVMKAKVNGKEIPFPTTKKTSDTPKKENHDDEEGEAAKHSSLPVGFPGNA